MTTFVQKRFLRGPKPFRATLLLLLLAAFLAAPASSDASIAWLNKHRVANGIPPVEEVPSFATAWCSDSGHDSPNRGGEVMRGWSPLNKWDEMTSPWTHAPLHEFDIYNPIYTAAGYAESPNKSACLGLGKVVSQPPEPTFYQFLSPAGPNMVAEWSLGNERPFAPQEAIGIPAEERTGPQILLYVLGFPGQKMSPGSTYPPDFGTPIPVEWSLTASDGSTVPEVEMVTANTVAAFGHPGTMYDGAIMIVRNPLPNSTTFHARIVWEGVGEGAGVRATQEFDFTTRPPDTSTGDPGKKRRSPKLRAKYRVRGKNTLVGRIRFAKGAKGGLRVVAACGKPRARKTLRVTKRWANGAIVKGRVKPCAGKLRVKTRVVASGEFKAAQARVQTLRVG